MIDTSSLDKVGEYIEQLEEGGKQARKRVIELVDEKNKLEEENKKLKEENNRLKNNAMEDMRVQTKLEDRLKEENKKLKGESEELKMWLREKLPLALLKEYMEKFEGVDLKNV